MSRSISIVLSVVLIGGVMFGTVTAAQAATAPLPSTTPQNTGMVDLPGASGTNTLSVRIITQAGNLLWLGGIFSEVDDANGNKVADAGNLAAFDTTTGLLAQGVHIPMVTNTGGGAEVYGASLGPNGDLYFAGTFDAVDGSPRHNVAAVDAQTGTLLPFAPNVGTSASSVLATPDAIYVGTGKLLSFQLSGAATPGYDPPQVFIDASLRGHVTIPAFRDIKKLGNTLVSACQCDSLTDDNGLHWVKGIVEIDATTGDWNGWAPLDPQMTVPNKPPGSVESTFDSWGIRAIIHNEPGTNTPAIYEALGGSDYIEAFDFSTGTSLWKTDCSGSCQDVTWYQGNLIFGGHFNWTASPSTSQCGSDDSPVTTCYFTPKLFAANSTTGKVLLDASGNPWNPGVCCKYNGVWATTTSNDGSTLYIGGEFDDVGGTWTCHTFQASCLSGKVLQRSFATFAGPTSATQTLSVATAGAGSGTVTSNTGGISCGLSCITDFATGAGVTLTATPKGSSVFTGWSSADPGINCPGIGTCMVSMSQARAVTATFANASFQLTVTTAGTGTGTVTSNPGGINCGATCSSFFATGASVTLTATPGLNATFSGWSGTGISCPGAGTCTVVMSQARAVTATFTPTGYSLTVTKPGPGAGLVTSSPAGINCGATCTNTFTAPTVTLTASANGGSAFNGWGGDGSSCGSALTCQITMSAARSVTADFETAKNLNVTVSGSGTVTSMPAGITCSSGVCTSAFVSGSTVTLTEAPGASAFFTSWSGDGSACGTATTCQVTMSAQRNVTATFVAAQTLTVAPGGAGHGTIASSIPLNAINCGLTCTANFATGTMVTLTATPDPSSSNFTGWSGGGCSGTGSCVVTMSAAVSVTANFGLLQRLLSVSVVGHGTLTSTPGSIDCTTGNVGTCSASYANGTDVELADAPDTNWTFTGWSGGGCTGTVTPCVVSMNGPLSVTATFSPIKDSVTVTTLGNGMGSVSDVADFPNGIQCGGTCTASYDQGSSVTLTASADPGSAFTGWSGACTGTGDCDLTIDGAKSVTATFQPQFTLTVTSPANGTITSGDAAIDCPGTCSAIYTAGAAVTLTGTPDAGYVLDTWGDSCIGTDPTASCQITVTTNMTASAAFQTASHLTVSTTGDGSGTITSMPDRINCVTNAGTCAADFAQSSTVELTAAAGSDSVFTGWTNNTNTGGDCDGSTTATCSFSLGADESISANFEPTYVLTVQATGGTAGTVTSDKGVISCPSTCSDSYLTGTMVTLMEEPGSNATFVAWGGDGSSCTGSTCQVTMTADMNVTAAFAPIQDGVNVTISGAGSGAVNSMPSGIACSSGTCGANFNQASSVTLTAVAGSGSILTGWSGDCAPSGATCVVTVGATNNVTATFGLAPHQLTVNVAGSGSVTGDSGGINCPAILCSTSYPNGTIVTLTAAPGTGYNFTGWTGGGCTGTGTCPVTMSADASVTATFTRDPQPLNLTVVGVSGGTGTVTSVPSGISCTASCSHSFTAGTMVTLTATPAAGTNFAWGGDCSGSSTCQVTMSATHNVTVTFTKSSTTSIDDIDPSIAYNGWFDVADAAASGGFYRMSSVKNDKATWKSPAATSITWVTRTGPDQGKASVTIDGKNKGTVDLYSAAPAALSKLYPGLANKAHTVVIKVLHTKNAASTGYNVRLDAFMIGTTTTQESATSIQYDTWKYSVVAKASGGSYHSATAATAYATVTFTGTSIDWITATGKAFGKASVTIDGVSKGTVDLYTAAAKGKVLESYGGLSAGTHTMVIQVLGTKNASATGTKVVVDGFTIHA